MSLPGHCAGYRFDCEHRLRWRWSKRPVVTVGGPVQVSLDKNRLHLKDEAGKEHKLEVLKKTLLKKEPDAEVSEPLRPRKGSAGTDHPLRSCPG